MLSGKALLAPSSANIAATCRFVAKPIHGSPTDIVIQLNQRLTQHVPPIGCVELRMVRLT